MIDDDSAKLTELYEAHVMRGDSLVIIRASEIQKGDFLPLAKGLVMDVKRISDYQIAVQYVNKYDRVLVSHFASDAKVLVHRKRNP